MGATTEQLERVSDVYPVCVSEWNGIGQESDANDRRTSQGSDIGQVGNSLNCIRVLCPASFVYV